MFFVSSWRGEKKFEKWGKGIKKIRIGGGGVGGLLLLGGGGSVPHYMPRSFMRICMVIDLL